MRSQPGTYALILQSYSSVQIRIGRWDDLTVEPGYYLYIGSAFGPGGVRARVLRHCRAGKSRHWHIDYLRQVTIPLGAWCSYGSRDLEHRWAHVLGTMADMQPVKGFGCSDCNCYAHLFQTPVVPDFARFAALAGGSVESWTYPSLDESTP